MNQFLAEVRIALDMLDPHVPGAGRQSLHDLRDAINAAFIQKAIDEIESQANVGVRVGGEPASTRAEVNFGFKPCDATGRETFYPFTVGDVVEFSDNMGRLVRGRLKEIHDNVATVTEGGEWGVGIYLLRRVFPPPEGHARPRSVAEALSMPEDAVDPGIRPVKPGGFPESVAPRLPSFREEPDISEADSIGPVPKGFGSHITTDEACS